MSKTIWQDTAVITADKYLLGQTYAFQNRIETENKTKFGPYATYLVVKNFSIGDDFFVPTDFIDVEKSAEDQIWLTITDKQIRARNFTVRPVDDLYEKVELPLRDGKERVITEVEGRDDIKPLPG